MDNGIKIESGDDIEIYRDDFNFKVYAGPGAGKTFFLVNNIKSIIENSNKLKIDSNRLIACITYTNVAVDEIRNRLDAYGKYVFVSTIHSFLNENIIKPYNKQLRILLKKCYNINVPNDISFSIRRDGFSLLNKEQLDKMLIKLENTDPNLRRKLDDKSSRISYFDSFKFDLNFMDFNKDIPDLRTSNLRDWSEEDILKIKIKMLECSGVLDFDDVLLFSYLLIKSFRQIQYSVRYLFPYILIDEYQDTTHLQNEIIKIIGKSSGISIGVIGDIAQAIYGFAGANYNDFINFQLNSKKFKMFAIEGNRRSKQNIVHFLNYIRQNDESISNQYCIGENRDGGEVVFLLSMKDDVDLSNYIPENTISICRRWTDAFLTVRGIPYKEIDILKEIYNINRFAFGNDTTSMFISDTGGWISQINFIAKIKNKVKNKNFSAIVEECNKIFDLDKLINPSKYQCEMYKQMNVFLQKMNLIDEKASYYNICKYINKSAEESQLPIKSYFMVYEENGINDYGENYNKLLKYLNYLTYPTLCKIANEIFVNGSKHITIHRVKGKEYDNVLVKFELADFYNSEFINILKNPDLFKDKGLAKLPKNSENPRVAYVGFSRAIEKLFILVKADMQEFKEIEMQMHNYMVKKNIKEKFYSVIDLNNI